jgi:hypothetical protein
VRPVALAYSRIYFIVFEKEKRGATFVAPRACSAKAEILKTAENQEPKFLIQRLKNKRPSPGPSAIGYAEGVSGGHYPRNSKPPE